MFRNILFNAFYNSCYTRKIILNQLFHKSQMSYFSSFINNNLCQMNYLTRSIVNKNIVSPIPCKNLRNYCIKEPIKPVEPKPSEHLKANISGNPNGNGLKLTIFQRFKATYAVYGKLCIVVHFVTYCGWFSMFYMIVRSGLDVKWYLTVLQFPDWMTNLLDKRGVGEMATAYILCKIFMVFRYALTVYLTRYFGLRLQKMGYMAPIKEENKIRNLAKEGKELSKVKLKSHLEKKMKR